MAKATPRHHAGSNFILAIFEQSEWWRKLAGTACAVLVIVCFVWDMADFANYEAHEEYWFSIIYGLFVVAAFVPIYRLAQLGDGVIPNVVIWSLLSMLATLTYLYSMYFVVTSNLAIDPTKPFSNGIAPTVDLVKLAQIRAQANLFLTIPPVILGVWTAITGLFVNYQSAKKNQRTSNAFALIMQTRTSTIYAENANAKQSAYPADDAFILKEEAEFIVPRRLADLPHLRHECENFKKRIHEISIGLQRATGDEQKLLSGELKVYTDDLKKSDTARVKIEGIAGIRYLLNYFEFMAKGIRTGDLDEEIIVGTLRAVVVGLYEDATEYREWIRDGNSRPNNGIPQKPAQPKAYEHLKWLIEGDANRTGWNKL
jgi:hypothetical protein